MRRCLMLLLLLLVPAVYGQQGESLSETERLRLELHKAQILLERTLAESAQCRLTLRGAQLADDQQQLKATVEKAHPGFVLDINAGQLVKAPEKKDGP